jgi:hypothetical protein
MDHMTVSQLKAAIEDLPDDATVSLRAAASGLTARLTSCEASHGDDEGAILDVVVEF